MAETKRCPYCDELIRTNAIKCRFCGSTLVDFETSIETTPETKIKLALADKYEVLEEIGRGGMASVYRAVQKSLNRTVAVKVIHQNLIHDKEFLERFHREAQVAAGLSHPNILTVYDEGHIRGVHYMTMEYIDGMDLLKTIKNKGKLSPNEVVNIVAPISEALDYVHIRGLIHRDVKTSNIILTKDGRPILTDFGIAHAAAGTKLTKTGTVIGTPEYMSPEQAQGKLVDGRSDLYSLGVVMYECLTGIVPFKGDTPFSTIYKILYEPLVLPVKHNSKIPGWLSEISAKALARNINNRFQSGKELGKALRTQVSVRAVREEDYLRQRKKTAKYNPKSVKEEYKENIYTKPTERRKQKLINSGLISAIIVLLGILGYLLYERGVFGYNPNLLEGCDPDKLTDSEKKRVELFIEKGDEFYSKGNLVLPEINNAVVNYREVIKICPYNVYAQKQINKIADELEAKINTEIKNSNLIAATQWIEAGLKNYPNSERFIDINKRIEVTREIARIKTLVPYNPDSAMIHTRKLLAENPNDPRLTEIRSEIRTKYISKADSFYTKNRWYEAKKIYQKVLDYIGPDNYVQSRIEACNNQIGQNSRVVVPDIIGMSLDAASTLLQNSGLRVGNISRIVKPDAKNMIINVIPAPGTSVQRGSTVGLIVGQ